MIDPDVQSACKRWGLPDQLIMAVIEAEGGRTSLIKAVEKSLPQVTTFAEALEVLCRSCVHAMSDFIYSRQADPFVAYWGSRWAPSNVANDPQHLNANWATNVERLWGV